LIARADTYGFAEPVYLWLLVIPAFLLLVWGWHLLRRRADAKRYAETQVLARRDRYSAAGDLPFWLCVVIAAGLCITALARPYVRVWVPGTAGADFVILQDGSASMHVTDVAPDRWQRSMRFLRTFADTLTWKQDRVGLALFAYFAAPQLRLSKDPDALFFFLDRLAEQPPFRLEDGPTWNTNIEEAVQWGLRLIETNEKLFGRTNAPKAFVVISDGQAWSGKVANALAAARAADVSRRGSSAARAGAHRRRRRRRSRRSCTGGFSLRPRWCSVREHLYLGFERYNPPHSQLSTSMGGRLWVDISGSHCWSRR